MTREPLPVDAILPALQESLAGGGAAVLVAATGSGKSTRAAPALLDVVEPEQSVLLLQPRRIAARLVAARIAAERASPLGQEVGYRVRFEARVSPSTRLEVLTEGLLARRLQDDPFLDGSGGWGRPVGAVVLDELHERSLHTDLALALLADLRGAREGLSLLCMSATLDPGPVAGRLGARVLEAPGRSFPIEIRHQGPDLLPEDAELPARVEAAVRALLAEEDQGDLLVFLPGAGEIERCSARLQDLVQHGVAVLPLHGRLPPREQDLALSPSPPPGARRKVILATNIAETSVTLPGIRAVVDAGLVRQPRLDPATGFERLETTLISRASADQRAGRAGRTGPGRCVRLWSAFQHGRRDTAEAPEIERLDLLRLCLEAFAWSPEPLALPWLQLPPAAAWTTARDKLMDLGALDAAGITAMGRRLVSLPVDPRLGRVLLAATERGQAGPAAALAALVTERDPWTRRPGLPVEDRLAALLGGPDLGADRGALDQARQATAQLARAVGASPRGPADLDALLPALLTGLPERLGRRREAEAGRDEARRRVKLASGRGAELAPGGTALTGDWLVALQIQGRERGEDRIELAVEVPERAVQALPARRRLRSTWSSERGAVITVEEDHIGALVLRSIERPTDPEQAALALARVARTDPQRHLAPGEAACALAWRVAFLRERRPELAEELPAWESLEAALMEVMPALCQGRRRLDELARADAHAALLACLSWTARQALDRLAPDRLVLPSGREAALDYDPHVRQGGGPVLRARVQQMFGCSQSPTVLAGTLPVTLHLLAPNQRPVQVTTDLAGFWERTWMDVRKDLRGRYPRHAWPEDPARAEPEDRPRRKQ